ncbi:MAG: hypothetical protein DID90_2727552455 [Candidatus Nitrotoga sp. LAW]|nr:MAG: hypothetical protein DID90_2727552455 [Candidatus Nitrotoga sp. LAW]
MKISQVEFSYRDFIKHIVRLHEVDGMTVLEMDSLR